MTRPAEDSERTDPGRRCRLRVPSWRMRWMSIWSRQLAGRAAGAGLSLTGEGGLRWRAGQRPVPSLPARRWMPRPAGGPAARDQADLGLSKAGSWREIVRGSGSDRGSS